MGLALARRRALHGEAYRPPQRPAPAAPGSGWPPEALQRLEEQVSKEQGVFDAWPGLCVVVVVVNWFICFYSKRFLSELDILTSCDM